MIPSPAQVILQLNFPDTKTSKTMENFINPPSLRVSLCCLIKQMYKRGICHMRLHPYFDYFQLSAVESRVDTSSDTFYNRGYGTPSADCRIEERAGVLGKLPLTAGGFADDFEYSTCTPLRPPLRGGLQGGGEKSLSLFFFFFPPFFIYLFIYLYRVSPRWGEALGRNKMSFFQEKIFLTKKNIFRPGANALVLFNLALGSLFLSTSSDRGGTY